MGIPCLSLRLYVAIFATLCKGRFSGDGLVVSSATGFVALPLPSTLLGALSCRRTSAACHVGGYHMLHDQAGSSAHHHSKRVHCSRRFSGFAGGAPQDAAGTTPAGMSRSAASLAAGSTTALLDTARARGPTTTTTEQMDSEWATILANDDDEKDDDESNNDGELSLQVEEGEIGGAGSAVMSDMDIHATDASQGGDLEGFGTVGGDPDAEGRKPYRVWYKSYKERMKAEKAREAARQERLKKLPKHHIEYLEQAQRNRDMAAARREKYTKKFFRNKKLHDIVKERGQKAIRETTRATRWPRKITRTLEELQVGEWIEGKVRNVENYGAWVDVNAERDGLLHVRDMSKTFTPNAEQVVATRDSVRVRVKFVDPGAGKLGLSLVEDVAHEDDLPPAPSRPKISMADVTPGAELWGYIERVTNLGAYVNVGAERPGFLLLKEVPGRPKGLDAPHVLQKNKRLRVYAKEVDPERLRIKLTCKRPRSRPRCGPAPALASDAYSEEFEYDDTRGRSGNVEGEEDAEWEREEWLKDDDDEEDDEEEEGDWFFPERGEVIPPPEEDLA